MMKDTVVRKGDAFGDLERSIGQSAGRSKGELVGTGGGIKYLQKLTGPCSFDRPE